MENITAANVEKPVKAKIAYIDHLKILATILVVLHHSFITYGAPGSWYYQQKTHLLAAQFPMTVFVATNQSFFMGFFFLLSALFIGPSYKKKGAGKFLTDRLKRLAIPLAFYSFVLSPVLNYTVEHYGYGLHHSFIEYMSGYHHWIDFGVMWFVAALLVFNFAYMLFKWLWPNAQVKVQWPNNRLLLIAGVLLGIASFLVRLIFPTGWELSPVGFQLGYFPQYIVAFIFGIVASNNKWMDGFDLKQGRQMAWMARGMVLLVLPAIFVWFLIEKFPGNNFNGGWNPVSFIYSLWEQVTGVMISVALLCIAKYKWNKETPLLKRMSADAFAVYVFHPLVLIFFAILLKDWSIEPALKLLVLAPCGVVGAFLFAGVLRKIPGVKEFL
jgi:surface polysaccharide O-acyltransferase-like enzyme